MEHDPLFVWYTTLVLLFKKIVFSYKKKVAVCSNLDNLFLILNIISHKIWFIQ